MLQYVMRSAILRHATASAPIALATRAMRPSSSTRTPTKKAKPDVQDDRAQRYQDNIAFLRSEDQRYLQRVLKLLNTDLTNVQDLRDVLNTVPIEAFREAGLDTTFIEYLFDNAMLQNDEVARAIAHSIEHHKDLQHEPYPEPTLSRLQQYEAQVQKMTVTERDKAFQETSDRLTVEERDWQLAVEKLEGLLVEALGQDAVDAAKREHAQQNESAEEWEDVDDNLSELDANLDVNSDTTLLKKVSASKKVKKSQKEGVAAKKVTAAAKVVTPLSLKEKESLVLQRLASGGG